MSSVLFLLLGLANVALGSLSVGFPFPEQYPNVARVNQPYSFQMANITYRSSNGYVAYNATNLPAWLLFDSASRTFSGSPTQDDVSDAITITLTGYDPVDQSFIANNYTLVCSADPGLSLSSGDVMFTEIAQYGVTNGQNGLVVSPGEQFSIKFTPDTFKLNPGSSLPIVAYYGRLIDRSSLPNWISFDPSSLSFYGTVPQVVSLVAPSINYGFSFIATDYTRYAGAVGNFYLVVGAHQLSTTLNESIKVNGTLKSAFNYEVPVFSSVYEDGQPISADNISSVFSNSLPSYVTLNQGNYLLTGTFPDATTFSNFSVVVQDKYGNQIDIPYLFDALGTTFTVESLPNVNATKGEWFSYQLLNSFFTEGNQTAVTVDYAANNTWLTFDKSNNTLQGTVPDDLSSVLVSVTAKNDFDTDTLSFAIMGVNKNATPASSSTATSSGASSTSSASTSSTSSASTSASASASASSSVSAGTSKSKSTSKALAIGLGVGIPCFVLVCLAIILGCCCLRRRNRNSDNDDEHIVPVKNLDYEKGARAQPEIDGPGFGITQCKDDHDEDPHQLAALNVLKLDEKDTGDIKSTSSSLTLGEHSDRWSKGSDYFDASERPLKSWRANEDGDEIIATAAAKTAYLKDESRLYRKSVASTSTVNTENLFSVRLVDDAHHRYSHHSSIFANQYDTDDHLYNGAAIKRDDSGNIQRLDSDGNIVDYDVLPSKGSPAHGYDKPKMFRSTSSNLNILMEESFQDKTSEYHSAHDANTTQNSNNYDVNTDHSFNLLSRFNQSADTSASNSEQNIYETWENNSLVDEFKATHTSNGEIQWLKSNEGTQDSVVPAPAVAAAPAVYHSQPKQPHPHPASSIYPNSMNNTVDEGIDKAHDRTSSSYRLSSSSLTKKAKLVDFTRKGSLRETVKLSQPDHYEVGHTAHIHDEDSE